jgi:hypothetical protein
MLLCNVKTLDQFIRRGCPIGGYNRVCSNGAKVFAPFRVVELLGVRQQVPPCVRALASDAYAQTDTQANADWFHAFTRNVKFR